MAEDAELFEEKLTEDIELFVYGDKNQAEKEKSWERIFDLAYWEERDKETGDGFRLQGTTGKIMLEDITFIKEFTAR